MGNPDVIPRLVTRGNTALSWDGPVPLADAWGAMERALEQFDRVLLWDLDGVERNRPNLSLVRKFEGEALWVDAGVRRAETVIDVLVAGAERAVVGTKTLVDLDEIEEAKEVTDNVVPLVDLVDGEVAGPEDAKDVPPDGLLKRWRDLDIDSVLVVDERMRSPPALLGSVPEGIRAFAGIAPRDTRLALPPGTGSVVDIWEVVPRKT